MTDREPPHGRSVDDRDAGLVDPAPLSVSEVPQILCVAREHIHGVPRRDKPPHHRTAICLRAANARVVTMGKPGDTHWNLLGCAPRIYEVRERPPERTPRRGPPQLRRLKRFELVNSADSRETQPIVQRVLIRDARAPQLQFLDRAPQTPSIRVDSFAGCEFWSTFHQGARDFPDDR